MNIVSKQLLGIFCGVKNGDDYWCISSVFSGLYKLDLITGIVEFIVELPEKNLPEKLMYSDILRYGDFLYIIPFYAKDVVVFDMKTNEIGVVQLEMESGTEELQNRGWRIAGGIIYDKWLILYPGMAGDIYRINLETKSIEKRNLLAYLLDKHIEVEHCTYMMNSYSHYIKENCIYIPMGTVDVVIKINMDCFEIDHYKIENENTGFCAIVFANGKFWLAPSGEGAFVCWDEKTNEIKRITQYPTGFQRKTFKSFTQMILYQDDIYILPSYSNMFLLLDMDNYVLSEADIGSGSCVNEENIYGSSSLFVNSAKLYGKDLYIAAGVLNGLLIYDLERKSCKKYFPIISKERYEMENQYIKKYYEKNLYCDFLTIPEKYYFDLNDYICLLLR